MGPALRRCLLTCATLVAIACRPAAQPSTQAPAAEAASPAEPGEPGEPAMDPDVVEVGGARLKVVLEGEAGRLDRARVHAWVRHSAEMVSDYYGGRFPVPEMTVEIARRSGSGVGFGQHRDGRWIRVRVGRNSSDETLDRDWVMPHEMLHAGFPDLDSRHRWMQEGLSTYLQTVLRVRAGIYTPEEMWSTWLRMMPLGRPAGDRGLDRSRSWGRLYWGGALFWMMVDLELRRRSDNRLSLRDVVQGLVAAGGDGRANWSTQRVREVADEATGTTVVSEIYAAMAEAPGDVDLDALWRELGVSAGPSEDLRFDDAAPLAAIRQGMGG